MEPYKPPVQTQSTQPESVLDENIPADNEPILKLSFPASQSPSVVGYKLYIEPYPCAVTYESKSFNLGNNTTVVFANLSVENGEYNVGITAVDKSGNETEINRLNKAIIVRK